MQPWLRNLDKIRYTTEPVYQHNSPETSQQNFMLLFMHVHIDWNFWFKFFLREHGSWGIKRLFCVVCLKLIWHVRMILNDREAVVVCFWQWTCNVTIIIQLLPIFDYDFWFDCLSLMHGIAMHYMQHCQAMLKQGVCGLAHFFFHLINIDHSFVYKL